MRNLIIVERLQTYITPTVIREIHIDKTRNLIYDTKIWQLVKERLKASILRTVKTTKDTFSNVSLINNTLPEPTKVTG